MLLHCPHCGQQIHADDINLDKALAKCRECNAVFSFADAVDEATDAAQRVPRRREAPADMPLPAGLKIEDWGPNLRFVRRWFTPTAFFMLFFCIVWDSFLVFWYTALSSEGGPGDGPGLIFWIFPIGHVAVGVGLTYLTLGLFLNTTVIEVGGELTIRHGPLPFPGNRTLNTIDIDQLYCQESVHHGKHGRVHYRYRLNAVTKDGRKIKLLSGLTEPDHAFYLEQQIEQRLGIRDRHVPGEMEK